MITHHILQWAELQLLKDFIRLIELAKERETNKDRFLYFIRIENDLKLLWYSELIDLQTKRRLAKRLNKIFNTVYF